MRTAAAQKINYKLQFRQQNMIAINVKQVSRAMILKFLMKPLIFYFGTREKNSFIFWCAVNYEIF